MPRAHPSAEGQASSLAQSSAPGCGMRATGGEPPRNRLGAGVSVTATPRHHPKAERTSHGRAGPTQSAYGANPKRQQTWPTAHTVGTAATPRHHPAERPSHGRVGPTQSVYAHPRREDGFNPYMLNIQSKEKKTVFYSYFARFMNTVPLNMTMFLSATGFTRRNTFFIFVWLRPRNT